MEHGGYNKLNGVLRGFLGNAFTLDGKEGGLDMSKMHEHIKKEKLKMNILLMGATGVGKSSLITLYLVNKLLKQAKESLSLSILKNILMKRRA
ncbi:GTPase of uncharacterised function family protein [Helicobacter acinonychis]|nr:GTPase of uncharacterised function family protein [Helicobacter acinonychis]